MAPVGDQNKAPKELSRRKCQGPIYGHLASAGVAPVLPIPLPSLGTLAQAAARGGANSRHGGSSGSAAAGFGL